MPDRAAVEPDAAALSLFVRLEAGAREAEDLVELRHFIVNETRKLNRARQSFLLEIDTRARVAVTAISSMSTVNRHSEIVAAIEALIGRMAAEIGLARSVEFRLPAYCDAGSPLAEAYPFVEMAWVPLADRAGHAFAGLLLAKDAAWTRDELAVTHRISGAYAHAWRELTTAAHFRPRASITTRWMMAGLLAIAALMLLPVPMTALAPAEVVAATPAVIAAEMEGVVDSVLIEPSASVRKGDPLVRLSDTTLRNRFEVAQQEVVVAEARVRQATILAFSEARGRHELGVAEAELALKKAELAFARDMLAKTLVRAPIDGIAIFADRKALVGKPVAPGERLIEVADPGDIEVRIDLPVPDAVVLQPASKVRIFLDVDPLEPWQGSVVRSDYRAQPSDSDVLAFRTYARLAADERPLPRIGLRGTAQVQGAGTVLGLYLLRRPLTALRQWIGL